MTKIMLMKRGLMPYFYSSIDEEEAYNRVVKYLGPPKEGEATWTNIGSDVLGKILELADPLVLVVWKVKGE